MTTTFNNGEMARFLTVPLWISSFTRSVMNNIPARSNRYLSNSSLSLYSPNTSRRSRKTLPRLLNRAPCPSSAMFPLCLCFYGFFRAANTIMCTQQVHIYTKEIKKAIFPLLLATPRRAGSCKESTPPLFAFRPLRSNIIGTLGYF